jgi:hypothetical protein
MDLLSPYGIGKGQFVKRDPNPITFSGTELKQSAINDTLKTELSQGRIDAPDANKLYYVYIQPGVLYVDDIDGGSGFSATHGFTSVGQIQTDSLSPPFSNLYYVVIPYPGSPNDTDNELEILSAFQRQTEFSSSALAAAVTDPLTRGNNQPPVQGVSGWTTDVAPFQEVWDFNPSFQYVALDNGTTPYVVEQLPPPSNDSLNMPAGTDLYITNTFKPTEGTFTGTIASFFDVDDTAGSYTAKVFWDDGTSSVATIVNRGGGNYDVVVSHPFSEEEGQNKVVTVTVNDSDGGAARVDYTATLQDAPLTASGTTVTATEGAQFTGTVGTFTDAGGGRLSDYTAQIVWGDGSTTSGTVSGANGGYTVSGVHAYAEDGAYSIRFTVNDAGGASDSALSTASLFEAVLPATGFTIGTTEGAVFSGAVATFADPGSNDPASEYTAQIDWGDGTTTTGIVTGGGGSYSVSGTHAYAEDGAYTTRVTFTETTAAPPYSATVVGAANVAEAAITPTGLTIAPTEGAPFFSVVATFADLGSPDPASNFTASIDWGDGATTTGTVAGAAGAYTVTGSHTYTEEGVFTTRVSFTDSRGR